MGGRPTCYTITSALYRSPVGLPSPLDKRKNYRKEEEKGKDNQEMYVHIRIQPGEKNRKRRSNTNMFRGHGQKERCI